MSLSAFPHPSAPESWEPYTEAIGASSGMSLRDYLAGKVLQGLAANPGGPFQANAFSGWGLVNCTLTDVVEIAYKTADAALVERAK